MEKKTVVYLHKRNDTGEVFYVGIGSIERAYEKTHNRRNKIWKDITNKTDYDVEIIYEVDTWIQACVIEIMLIQKYGRKNLGLGTLANMTDGGDGVKGFTHTDKTKKEIGKKLSIIKKGVKPSIETKIKMSESHKGERNSFFGKSHNDKTKKNISIKMKSKNLNYQGELNNAAKVNEEEVLFIRNNGVKGHKGNVKELAKKFNVSVDIVRNIINRKTWTHI